MMTKLKNASSNGNTFDAFKNNFTVTPAMWNGFKTLVQKEVKKGYSETNLNQDKNDLQLMMKAYLARQLYKADKFYPIIYDIDKGLKKAYEEIMKM